MTSLLSIVEHGYRATLEEQDDTIVWITHVLRGAGADAHLLLQSSAVGYAVRAQDAAGLSFGAWKQTRPPDLAGDLGAFLEKGGQVFVLQDDLAARGIRREELIDGVELVARSALPQLVERYDRVWRW